MLNGETSFQSLESLHSFFNFDYPLIIKVSILGFVPALILNTLRMLISSYILYWRAVNSQKTLLLSIHGADFYADKRLLKRTTLRHTKR